MFHSKNDSSYIKCMETIKELAGVLQNHERLRLITYERWIKKIVNILFYKKHNPLKGLWSLIKMGYNRLILRLKEKKYKRESLILDKANYFTDERIAVYTCIFGKYDKIIEPLCEPDNIDYFIITDSDVKDSSIWKKVSLSPFDEILMNKTNVEKNRWFKMHSFEVFPDYKYTIYIDGNIKPLTDFTEFVNRLGKYGIAMFRHGPNNCVYQEALYNYYSIKKISNNELNKHIDYLRKNGMPENFGMTTCNVIVRDRDNEICRKLMDDWWEEFMNHCRRDQISFPYVVWKNGLKMEEIGLLGDDVWNSNTLFVENHE